MIHALALTIVAAAGSPGLVAQEPDFEGPARSAAYRYESLIRRRAPSRLGGSSGGPCDEVIGRFCFRFDDDDSPEPPPEPEHPDVTAARRLAIRAFRAWLSAEPAEPRAAGGLIRYLIEDGRAREAVSIARTHAWAAPGSGSLLLLGLALHHAEEFVAAEAAFDSARWRIGPVERARLDDVGVLLEPDERAAYEDLSDRARPAYHERFWALADPSRRIPGNERRSAHYARHAWIRILSEAPRAFGMTSWGDDHEEIVLRFGLPRHREQVRGPSWRLDLDPSIISVYDPHAVTFVPTSLRTTALPETPEPGAESDRDARVPRSLYAPVGLPVTRALHPQVTRLPTPDGWILRLDAALPQDTTDPDPVDPQGLLVVLDTLGREQARAPGRVGRLRDSVVVVRAETPLPYGTHVYQLEVTDDSTGVAGLARYRVEAPEAGLRMSDPLIAEPKAGPLPADRSELVPAPTAVLAPDQAVLVYAQVVGLRRVDGRSRYAVEWWLEPRGGGSPLGQALRWVGRRLGLAGASSPVRVRWDATSDASDPLPVAFVLDLSGARAGAYRLGLRVVDRVSGRSVESYRALRLDPAARPLLAPGPD